MTNEVMKLDDDADDFDIFAVEGEEDRTDGNLLAGTARLKFGTEPQQGTYWLFAQSNKPVTTPLALIFAGYQRVTVRFHDQIPETEILAPGEKFPNLEEKNKKVSQSEWVKNKFTGQLEGPWQNQFVLLFVEENSFDRYSWVAPLKTVGSVLCVKDIIRKWEWVQQYRGKDVAPVVKLSDTFMKTRFGGGAGGRQRPHLEVIKWITLGGGGGGSTLSAAPEPKQLTASPPTVPAASPVRVPEMGPKSATTGERLDAFAKTGKPVEAPTTSTDLDEIPF
jgi:hypothetical protein